MLMIIKRELFFEKEPEAMHNIMGHNYDIQEKVQTIINIFRLLESNFHFYVRERKNVIALS